MKKAIPLIIIGILALSGLHAGAFSEIEVNESNTILFSENFSHPKIAENGNYISLEIEGIKNSLKSPGCPELPMYTQSVDIPFGAKNIKISFNAVKEFECELDKAVKPSPQIVINDFNTDSSSVDLVEDEEIYNSDEVYPETWYASKISCGLISNKNRVTHISFYIYPIRYSPNLNKIYYINEFAIEVNYDAPIQTLSFGEEYDLLIIAPSKFSKTLNKLVEHKNSNNVKTLLKTTDSIYDEYPGFDKPEQIKYCIKDMIETYNIEFVLLVGGLKSYFQAKDKDDCNQGSKSWYVPVRYSNVRKSGLRDEGALCDLYYSDIYEEGGNFSSWDSNGDGIYAKKDYTPDNDEIDFLPDVYVGRLACRSMFEVKTVVNKIIKYESITPTTKSWYNRMVGISGLSHANYSGQPDGEYLTDLGFSYMEDIIEEEVRIYASNEGTGEPTPVRKDIVKAFTNGAKYIFFSGHGHPLRWATHPVGDLDTWMEGMHIRHMWKFFNLNKLPIVVVGGCHNGQFNVSWLNTYRAKDEVYDNWYWTHGDPGFHCFCWRMIAIPWGGAIVSVGGTGLTTSLSGNPNTGNSRLATDFFYNVGKQNATTFGEAFSKTILDYINNNTMSIWDCHVITIWNALGDPSLKL